MDNQTPQPASAPVTPSGSAYTTPLPLMDTSTGSKNRFLIIAGIVILLLILGGGGYFYFMNMQQPKPAVEEKVMTKPSPTPLPTVTPMVSPEASASESANWKTYTSLDKTYTVQYPTDMFIRYICPEEELTLSPRGDEKEESVTMPTCGRDGLYTIEVITLKQPSIPPQSDENYTIVKKDVMVGGIPAQAYTRTLIKEPEGPSVAFSEDVFVTNNGKYYQIHLGNKDLQTTFNKMLASFKFTK
jgi:hypothetical protein